MVLQQETSCVMSGWDKPGRDVHVAFRGTRVTATADAAGRWSAAVPAGPAGGPFEALIAGSTEIRLRDVLVGEVWLASGQSNMEWRMNQCPQYPDETKGAHFPAIRFFTVPNRAHAEPQDETPGAWRALSPESAPDLSAVAFFFARRVHRSLQVPIGVIVSAWGGTPAETWIPAPAFQENKTTRRILDAFNEVRDNLDEKGRDIARRIHLWEVEHMPADPGNGAVASGWARPDFDDAGWPCMSLPGYWQSLPEMNFNGVVWFRRTLDLPASWQGQELEVQLGAVDDFDDTYANGERIGGLGKDVNEAYAQPRCYRISSRLTRTDRLTLAVRVFDHYGLGGFRASPGQMRVVRPSHEGDAISIQGDWRYQVEHRLPPPPPDLFQTRPYMPPGVLPQGRPAYVFNAMIHPLRHTALRGVIWYQGESNGGRSGEYADVFRTLIQGWRAVFNHPDLAFLFVQLPNFAGGTDWPQLREAQTAARSLPHTGMAVTLDVGDAADIHPINKKPVGDRLAALALHGTYGVSCPSLGPALCSIEPSGNALRIAFANADEGLATTDGGDPRGFEICGPDGVFIPAAARIEGSVVVVRHPDVACPVGARYAFTANPQVNLVNAQGLPAEPFRCDSRSR